MNDRMRTGMAEAMQLTRAGKLVEATNIIRRTLRGTLASAASPDTADWSGDDPVHASLGVADAAALPKDVSVQRLDHQDSNPAARTAPPADAALTSAKLSDTQPHPREDEPTGSPSTIQHISGSEPADSAALAPARPARFRPPFRFPRNGFRAPLSLPMSMPDLARREIWAGGQFIDGSYTNHAGTRIYKVYIPSGYHGQALPLVVMLHGCTQNPDDFAAGTRINVLAERDLFFVVYPAQAAPANQSKCWNWFKETDQHRGRGEPSIIAGITTQVVSTYQLDTRRVYLAGLSAGGAMAAIMGVSYPDLYAAIGVHSGLPYGAAHDLPSAFTAMQHGATPAVRRPDSGFPTAGTGTRIVPTIVFHGDQDTTVHPRNGDQVLAQWGTIDADGGAAAAGGTHLRMTVNEGQVPHGHAYTRSIYRDTSGDVVMERWLVHGAGHGWSGGSPHGSFTDPRGPDASQEMVRFFSGHRRSEL